MKRTRLLSGLLAGALFLTLAACGPKEGPDASPSPSADPAPTPSPSAQPVPSPSAPAETEPAPAADPVWGEQSFDRTFTAGDGTTVLSVSYALPLVQNTDACPAGAAINSWYKAQGSDLLGYAEDNYELAVSDYEVSKASGFDFTPTAERMDYAVTYAGEDYYSIRRSWTITGAMPYSSQFCLSEQFDAATGDKVGFADLFDDADGVRERVVAAFLAQEEIAAGGFTEAQITAVYQPEHFYLSDGGYVFWIQGNDLPALHSPVEVTLSFDALADLRHG